MSSIRPLIVFLVIVAQIASALGAAPRAICECLDGSTCTDSAISPCCCNDRQEPACCDHRCVDTPIPPQPVLAASGAGASDRLLAVPGHGAHLIAVVHTPPSMLMAPARCGMAVPPIVSTLRHLHTVVMRL